MGLAVDAKLMQRLDMLAATAAAFAKAHAKRNPDHDWLTLNERESLANLRAQLAALEREEQIKAA
jgi:hypothetical protein